MRLKAIDIFAIIVSIPVICGFSIFTAVHSGEDER
jgi:hypothetical protein